NPGRRYTQDDDVTPNRDRSDILPEFRAWLGSLGNALQQANSAQNVRAKALRSGWVFLRNAVVYSFKVSPCLLTKDNLSHASVQREVDLAASLRATSSSGISPPSASDSAIIARTAAASTSSQFISASSSSISAAVTALSASG